MRARNRMLRWCVRTLALSVCLQGLPCPTTWAHGPSTAPDHLAPKHRRIDFTALAKKLPLAGQPGQLAFIVQTLLRLEKEGFSREQLESWVWVVAQQGPVVEKLGLEPFFEFAMAHGWSGVLALAAANISDQPMDEAADLFRAALLAKRLLQSNASWQRQLQDLLARRALYGKGSPASRYLQEVESQLQKNPNPSRNQTELEEIGECKQWFGQKWADAMEVEFARLKVDRWMEWQILKFLWEMGIPRDDFCKLALEGTRASITWQEYCRKIAKVQEQVFFGMELRKFLSKGTGFKDAAKLEKMVDFYRAVGGGVSSIRLDLIAQKAVSRHDSGRGIKLEISELKEMPPVQGTEIKIQMLIASVIRNAVEAMPKGGNLRLATRQEDNDVVLEMQDTGFGIPTEYMPLLWKLGTKEKRGNGLALGKRWLQSMGGNLELESQVGVGTVVRVRLPAAGRKELDLEVLGDFESLGSPQGALARLHRLFFGAFGSEVFQVPRGVPHRFTSDPVLVKAIAREIYQRLSLLVPGENYVVHHWGFGGMLKASVAIAEELEHLDRAHRAHYSDSLRYVVSDIASRMVQEAQQEAKEIPVLENWRRRGILTFRVVDAMDPPQNLRGSVDLVLSSYLYDSLPQRMITKVEDRFYEIKIQLVLKNGIVTRKDGSLVLHEDFREMILKEDLAALSQLKPQAFELIQWRQKLEPLDVFKEPLLTQLGVGADQPNGTMIPLGDGMTQSLRRTLPLLKPGGEIWTLDHVVLSEQAQGLWGKGYGRAMGAVWVPLNAKVIRRLAQEEGVGCNITPIAEWLENRYEDRMTNAGRFQGLKEAELATYFPIHLLRNYPQIEKLSQEILSKEGYGKKGRGRFFTKVKKILGDPLVWDQLEEGEKKNYLEDLQLTIVRAVGKPDFLREALSDTGWISAKQGNEKFLQAASKIGFHASIVDHLLGMRESLNKKLGFYLVRMGPTATLAECFAKLDAKGRGVLDTLGVQMLAKFFRPEYREALMANMVKIVGELGAADASGSTELKEMVARARGALWQVLPDGNVANRLGTRATMPVQPTGVCDASL